MAIPTERSLKSAITKAKSKAYDAISFDEKLLLTKDIKKAEKRLYNFRLNFFVIEDIINQSTNKVDAENEILKIINQ